MLGSSMSDVYMPHLPRGLQNSGAVSGSTWASRVGGLLPRHTYLQSTQHTYCQSYIVTEVCFVKANCDTLWSRMRLIKPGRTLGVLFMTSWRSWSRLINGQRMYGTD
jgi:hypothetical protein